jgi:nitrate reductase NapAB chaperone NapD
VNKRLVTGAVAAVVIAIARLRVFATSQGQNPQFANLRMEFLDITMESNSIVVVAEPHDSQFIGEAIRQADIPETK